MNDMLRFDRRSFLVGTAAVSGGLSLGFRTDGAFAAGETPEVNAWVVVKPDDTVVIRIARSEMGQGSLTGLAQMVAEELECDWSKVTWEYPSPAQNVARKRVWGNYNSTGSQSIRQSQDYVRKGGAAAREMLIQAAANEWKVPAGECSAANSIITHKKSARKISFGKVAAAAAKLEPPKEIVLKDPKNWKLIGKGVKRLDTLDKLTGKQVYGIDIQLPGMLIATVRACMVNGGKLTSFDADKVKGMRGVKSVVRVSDDSVAVVADTFWNARTALAALPVVWDLGENAKVSSASIADMLKEGLSAEQAYVGNKQGDAAGAIAGAAKKVEAVYSYPYQHHVTMEPMNTTALYTAEKCEIWCPTQNGEGALAAVAEASGLPVDKCDVHKLHLGGGFGRRARTDFVSQAVSIAKQMPGTPVKLIWTREEDMGHCAYHPVTQCKFSAGLDADGKVTGLHMRISGQSILASLLPQALQNGMDPAVFQGLTANSPEGHIGYDIPNVLIDHAMRNTHLLAGFWRGVNLNQNALYLESFMDELAKAAGQDPLEFRRKMLKPKHRAVLDAAAAKANYGKAPKGIYQGVAQIMGFGSYVAAIADVSVSDGGQLKIHRIVGATDCGYAVNPAQIERQIAGSFVYGLTAAMYGEITVKDGAVEQTNFDSYNMMRIDEMPKIECVIVPSGGFWGGVGEPTIAVAAPAVLNGIALATGKRIRDMPLMNHSLKKA
ncbi:MULTISPECIES: molybdopterin cofactor-binding domain-containing protein [unclassified Beijerinckia]|uniref:xanthine dehydrogenase family protein molybdopterin-binding subunit n=1 Tax=unclassified Beijerinckia TaxID=2638183 RepID=UPI000897C57A|nr:MULTISPECIES: molybdopterin cofactor-binding domain-containing protein [unclassified Beijerinckia]MDH7794364.1 isoquinoline 1-oxidoreductase beta subunit [Beijerinckia sp. GAS462]SEB60025.1 isoquinoline 1-oxidoreductase, beta subunit [Beijerinckia sp. 28-YEA-48]